MAQKSRTELQGLFKTGAKPSQQDFADFIESTLNIKDDGIEKPSGADNPLKIKAQSTDEKLLDFYAGEAKTWSINQKPQPERIGLNISNSGVSRLFIASSDGNVGIGTTNPGAKLEINGDLKLQLGVAVNQFSSDSTLAGNSDLTIPTEKAIKTYVDTKAPLAGSSNQDFQTKNLTVNGAMTVAVRNTVHFELGLDKKLSLGKDGSFEIDAPNVAAGRFVVTQGGNVGIGTGTTTPGAKLEVKGDLKLQNGVAVNKISSDGTLVGNSDLTIPTEKAIKTYADTKALISGSSAQDFQTKSLTVSGSISFGASTRQMVNLYSQDYGIGVQNSTQYFRTGGNFAWYKGGIHDEDPLNPRNGTVQMVIKDGNVGIGTKTPSEKLEVDGNLKVSGKIFGKISRLTSDNGSYFIALQDDRNLCICNTSNGSPAWCSGSNVSDINFKTEICEISNSLEKLLSLRGVSFYWKDKTMGESREIGVIAQEVEQVFPELVKVISDEQRFVQYEKFVPILIEAIKQQQQLISELREDIKHIDSK
ncbi:MAG: tail fiber domain-containing protein [Nostoc sp.]|uniref:tail fiber domain-containing protein n=1 Tax=Nostoc sp. TaxID=1180 RepID=UPI002FF995E5